MKPLGIKIDNQLDFNDHVSTIYKKASLKLHALARVSHFTNKDKLRVLMKAFVDSQFGYCPLIWMFLGRILNNKINKLHERALRLVYKNKTFSFDELLDLDEYFTIHHRNVQSTKKSPAFMQSIFPELNNKNDLRSESAFNTNNIRTMRVRLYPLEAIRYGR